MAGQWINKTEGTDLACGKTKENKMVFGEHSAFQLCLIGISEVEGDNAGRGRKSKCGCVCIQINLQGKHSHKISEIQISTSVLHYEKYFLRSRGNMPVLTIRRTYGTGR